MRLRSSWLIPTIVVLALGQGCNRPAPPPDRRTAEQKAESEWFNKRAKELNGNFDALTPEEKQRAIKASNNSESSARMGFGYASKLK
ncbi:MAG: hypothetical protein SFU56_06765 [Capsulimonadales bacterium]|nr:hypothetical protein [Capsulimonadales bacterium]